MIGWIETVSFPSERRTMWTVKIGDEVVHDAEVQADDPSGLIAHDAAIAWAHAHHPNITFEWKHTRGDMTGRMPRMQ